MNSPSATNNNRFKIPPLPRITARIARISNTHFVPHLDGLAGAPALDVHGSTRSYSPKARTFRLFMKRETGEGSVGRVEAEATKGEEDVELPQRYSGGKRRLK